MRLRLLFSILSLHTCYAWWYGSGLDIPRIYDSVFLADTQQLVTVGVYEIKTNTTHGHVGFVMVRNTDTGNIDGFCRIGDPSSSFITTPKVVLVFDWYTDRRLLLLGGTSGPLQVPEPPGGIPQAFVAAIVLDTLPWNQSFGGSVAFLGNQSPETAVPCLLLYNHTFGGWGDDISAMALYSLQAPWDVKDGWLASGTTLDDEDDHAVFVRWMDPRTGLSIYPDTVWPDIVDPTAVMVQENEFYMSGIFYNSFVPPYEWENTVIVKKLSTVTRNILWSQFLSVNETRIDRYAIKHGLFLPGDGTFVLVSGARVQYKNTMTVISRLDAHYGTVLNQNVSQVGNPYDDRVILVPYDIAFDYPNVYILAAFIWAAVPPEANVFVPVFSSVDLNTPIMAYYRYSNDLCVLTVDLQTGRLLNVSTYGSMGYESPATLTMNDRKELIITGETWQHTWNLTTEPNDWEHSTMFSTIDCGISKTLGFYALSNSSATQNCAQVPRTLSYWEYLVFPLAQNCAAQTCEQIAFPAVCPEGFYCDGIDRYQCLGNLSCSYGMQHLPICNDTALTLQLDPRHFTCSCIVAGEDNKTLSLSLILSLVAIGICVVILTVTVCCYRYRSRPAQFANNPISSPEPFSIRLE